MDVTALRLFSFSCPSIALYEEGALKTKKSVMLVTVRIPLPAMIGRVMVPTGWIKSPEKPFSSVGVGLSLVASMPIFMKACPNNMSADLPL